METSGLMTNPRDVEATIQRGDRVRYREGDQRRVDLACDADALGRDAAVANAIVDATGVRIRRVPIPRPPRAPGAQRNRRVGYVNLAQCQTRV